MQLASKDASGTKVETMNREPPQRRMLRLLYQCLRVPTAIRTRLDSNFSKLISRSERAPKLLSALLCPLADGRGASVRLEFQYRVESDSPLIAAGVLFERLEPVG